MPTQTQTTKESHDLREALKEAGLSKLPLDEDNPGFDPTCNTGCSHSCETGCSQGCAATDQPGDS